MRRAFRSESPCIVAAMRASTRRLTQLYDEAMAPTGLRVTQFHVLSELERRSADPPTVGELAEILTMERSALGQTLRPLTRDGFIDLGQDERDGRVFTLALGIAPFDAARRARKDHFGHETSGIYRKLALRCNC